MGNSVIYEYDGFNRLTDVSEGINKAKYKYNSSGLRTSKTVNGEKTDFILDGIYVIAEIKDGDVTNYIRGVTGIIYSKNHKGEKKYYVTNNHGDVTALVNNSGNIVKEYAYDEYGVETNPDKKDTNPFRYCGEYYDNETGFIYLRARYYDPTLGRFISEDPAFSGFNWYLYCNANPTFFIDPFGLDAKVAVEEISQRYGLSYKINKNGTVTVKQKFAGGGSLSGTFKSDSVADGVNLIDSAAFADIFGKNLENVKSGGYIVTDGTVDQEAFRTLNNYNQNSEVEYAVKSYELLNNSGWYFVTPVFEGEKNYIRDTDCDGKDFYSQYAKYSGNLFALNLIYSFYHAHTNQGSPYFSGGDFSFASNIQRFGLLAPPDASGYRAAYVINVFGALPEDERRYKKNLDKASYPYLYTNQIVY